MLEPDPSQLPVRPPTGIPETRRDDRSESERQRIGILTAAAAPWRWLLRPRRAGETLGRGPATGALIALFINLGLFHVVVFVLQIWESTVDVEWTPPAKSAPTPSSGSYRLIEQSFGEALAGFVGYPTAFEVAARLTWLAVLSLGAIALLAWFLLPNLHQRPPLRRSYMRCYRAVIASSALVVALVVLCGVLIVLVSHSFSRQLALAQAWGSSTVRILPIICVLSGLVAVVTHISFAVRGARGTDAPNPKEPRCEGCGYDLTHLPERGRCTECGLDLDRSLDESVSRPGPPFEQRPSAVNWVETTLRIIFAPRAFYRRLPMRHGEHLGDHFARRHLPCIGTIFAAWLTLMLSLQPFFGIDDLITAACSGIAVGLLGWAIARAFAGGGLVLAYAGNRLPNPAWGRRIMSYEIAYLWVPLAFTLVTLTPPFFDLDWFTAFANARLGGIPVVVLFYFGSYALMLIIGFIRYHIAVRQVQWSNF